MRLFTAIELPSEVKRDLELLAGGIPGARWQDTGQMHLTLRFIGQADDALAADIQGALGQVRGHPLEISLRGMESFGSARQPRVLAVGVETNHGLMALQQSIESSLVRAGVPAESRKYRPHVTLARLKKAPVARVAAFLQTHANYACEPFSAAAFTLFSSRLSHQGAEYRAEALYPLGF